MAKTDYCFVLSPNPQPDLYLNPLPRLRTIRTLTLSTRLHTCAKHCRKVAPQKLSDTLDLYVPLFSLCSTMASEMNKTHTV